MDKYDSCRAGMQFYPFWQENEYLKIIWELFQLVFSSFTTHCKAAIAIIQNILGRPSLAQCCSTGQDGALLFNFIYITSFLYKLRILKLTGLAEFEYWLNATPKNSTLQKDCVVWIPRKIIYFQNPTHYF